MKLGKFIAEGMSCEGRKSDASKKINNTQSSAVIDMHALEQSVLVTDTIAIRTHTTCMHQCG